MKFSVIIPVYNNDIELLKKAIDSVLNQTFKDFEIVLVNDGSTYEPTISVMEEMSCLPQVKYVFTERNRGISGARQYGIDMSSGEWICFLDCDDTYEPNYLEAFYQAICNKPDVLMFSCGYQIVDISGTILQKYPSKNISLQTNNIHFWTTAIWNRAYKKSFIVDNHIHFPEGCLTEDMAFLLQIIMYADTFSFIEGYTYNNLNNSRSTSRSAIFTRLSIEQMPFYILQQAIDKMENNISYTSECRFVMEGFILEYVCVLCCLLSRHIKDKKELSSIVVEGCRILKQIPDLVKFECAWNSSRTEGRRAMIIIEKVVAYAIRYKLERPVIYVINRVLGKLY